MKIWRKLKLLKTQLAVVLAIAMLPAGVIAVVQAISGAAEEAEQRRENLANIAIVRAREERDLFVEVRESMRSAAAIVAKSPGDQEICQAAAASIRDAHVWVSRALLVDRDGKIICGADQELSIADRPYWKEFIRSQQFTISDPRRSGITGKDIVVALHPVIAPESRYYAIGVGIQIDRLTDLARSKGADEALSFALVGNGGTVIALADGDSGDWLPDDPVPLLGFLPRSIDLPGRDATERHYFAHPLVTDEVWALAAAEPLTFMDRAASREAFAIVTPIVLWLIAVGVVFVAINRLVTRHVADLRSVATRIGVGDLNTEIRPFDDAPSEIRGLAEAIRRMSANLQERDHRLRELLDTKQGLLLEVHHRVKNNLQMISSLVNIQQRRTKDGGELEALQVVQDRIHGLALVHQNLYAGERLDHVALDQLLGDICHHIAGSLGTERSVEVTNKLSSVTVDAEIATPVALFLTEALGNAFKHARGGDQPGRIEVELEADTERFRLRVQNPVDDSEDTGKEQSGLGLRLMQGFAGQLSGKMTTERGDGTFTVVLEAPISKDHQPAQFKVRRTVK